MIPKLIYVAGPYRASTAWGIERNIHAAREMGARIAVYGCYPMIPHANTAHFDGLADDALWLGGTLEMMRRCDAAVFLSNFRESSGACNEYEEAERMKMLIYIENVHDDLGGFLYRNKLAAT